jgi:hypothetical protein
MFLEVTASALVFCVADYENVGFSGHKQDIL